MRQEVVQPMPMVVFHDTSDGKHVPVEATQAVQTFGKMPQQDSESTLDCACCLRFASMLEHVKKLHSEVVPLALLDDEKSDDDDESSVSSDGTEKGNGVTDATTEESQASGSSVVNEDMSLGRLRCMIFDVHVFSWE